MSRAIQQNGFVSWLRRLRALLITALAVVIILAAIIVGVGRMLVPHADHLRPWLEEMLSDRLEHPVRIDAVEARWPRLTPQISLHSIRVGEADEPLASIDQARVELHLPNLVRHDRNLVSLVVLGLDLVLSEDEQGRWGVQIEGGGQFLAEGDRERALAGDLVVRDARVGLRPRALPETEWRLSEADIRRSAGQTVLVASLHSAFAPEAGVELRMQAEHPREGLHSLRGWIGVDSLGLERLPLEDIAPAVPDPSGIEMATRVWLDWSRDQGASIDADFSLSGPETGPVKGSATVERRGGRIDGRLLDLTVGDRAVVGELIMAHRDRRWAVSVDTLDLAGLHRMGEGWLTATDWWPDDLAGEVVGLDAAWDSDAGMDRLAGRVHQLTLGPIARAPGVRNLDLDLSLAGDRAVLVPSGTPTVDWPRMMRGPVHFDRVGGRALVSVDAIELDGVEISHSVTDARADGWVYLGGERAFLDFGVEVERLQIDDASPWLPHDIIPETALQWLDRAVTGVGAGRGSLRYHMRAGQKAADFDPGDFHAWLDFSDASLDYAAGWPEATDLDGHVEFSGRSLFGHVDRGRMGEVTLGADQVVINDLTRPELSFLIVADAVDAGELSGVLSRMPALGWEEILAPMQWSGPVSVTTEINLPFGRLDEWSIDGEISMEGTDFSLPAVGVGLQSLEGTAFFDRHGVLPCVLHARTGQRPVMLDLAADFEAPAHLQLGGELHPADLVIDEGLMANVINRFIGSSYWQLELSGAEGGGLQLGLHSDLEGLALELPEPLAKESLESWPLEVDARLGDGRRQVYIRLADRLDAGLVSVPEDWRVGVGIGGAEHSLPGQPGFDVQGRLERLDLDEWTGVAARLGDEADLDAMHGRARLQLGRLGYGDVYVEDIELEVNRDASSWVIAVNGEGAVGTLTIPVPLDSGRVLAVDFDRLVLGDDSPDWRGDELEQRPGPEQTSTVSPAGLPPLHMLIEDFTYDALHLGRVRVEAHAISAGMEFERIDVDSPVVRLQGLGRWIDTDQGPRSEFEGRLITTELSELLAGLGYEAGIEAARSQVDISGGWPGAPHDFSLRRLQGDLTLGFSDGLIPEARPGAGRLLGLVSVSTIPRRLLLDFRDVFAQGLKFDQIDGEFRIGDGIAATDGLRIDSPAAQITVSGSTDMIARQYDQHLLVEPGVGATLPVIGVIAGGPAGALAGLVLQTLFDRPLRGITEARYAVTGSWDSPVVELVEARVADEEGEEELVVPERPDPD